MTPLAGIRGGKEDVRKENQKQDRSRRRTLLGIAIVIMITRHVLVFDRSSRGRRKIRERATRGSCGSSRWRDVDDRRGARSLF
jgi:hypothetical protein